MSTSREESPDWLRSFQVPETHSPVELSSDSEASLNGVPSGEDKSETHSPVELSSDSEASLNGVPSREDKTDSPELSPCKSSKLADEDQNKVLGESVAESTSGKKLKRNSPKQRKKAEDQKSPKKKKLEISKEGEGNSDDAEVAEEEPSGKHIEPHVSTSRLPLVLSEKVQRSKALVECEGESIDLSGDMGAVGRVIISDSKSADPEMYLDLKGTIYKTTIVPSRTFCVVSFGQSEAKIEAIMNDFIQLKPQSNVDEAETMVEGTLDGFSFNSEDEGDKLPKATPQQADQNEDAEEQNKGVTKAKAKKASTVVRKRAKPAGGKPQSAKKPRKKPQVSKKAKGKK
ncbi:DNA-binding protein BIN4 [Pyrus x bretschneideri]|uniref:DNA-binding protein BIN4 n=1 Tax=Pyrus x bretschneideri TaxID=225117 RepID=UPI00202FCD33|nr:DNA-binding protein BIN4 [Pyrus x bretschneideri]XP_048421480.1 DNA-binding protein BIN4 [Pyrus x bretschneideri]